MQLKNRKPLGLEALEDRWVPATVRFDGSNLLVTSPFITAGASKVSVIEQATGGYKVLDGIANNGTYAVTGNITVLGNNAKDNITATVITTLPGNLFVTTGNGASSVTVDGTAATSAIGGNTRLNLGLGKGTVAVGSTNGIANKGSLQVSSRSSAASTLTVGGGANSTFVGGTTTISGFPTITLGGANKDVFAGGVNVNNTGNSQTALITLAATSTDLGNLTVTGGQGATTVNVNGNILGTAAFNLGNATNSVVLGGTAAAPAAGSVSVGNLFYNGGNGSNALTAAGPASANTVLGNAVLNWGNGANSLGATTGLAVNGNLLVNTGNGSLDVATNKFEGVVNGNLNANAGNGNNLFTLDGAGTANVLGTFNYAGGNGGNSVTVTTQATDFFTLHVRFGNGSANLFTIGTGPGAGFVNGTLTGLIAWGVPTTASATNGFVDNGYVWQNDITLINVPS